MSFPAKNPNPETCHSGPRPGIQPAFESFPPLCLCAFVPLCLPLVSFRQKNSQVRVITGKKRPKTCHFRRKTPIQESSLPLSPSPLCAFVPLCLCAFPLCHSWPRPGIQSASVPLCLCAFVPSPCVIPAKKQPSACHYRQKTAKNVSFPAKNPNPGIQPAFESFPPLCLCAFVPSPLCAFPLCPSWLDEDSILPLCLPLVSFPAKNPNPGIQPAFESFPPLCLCAFVPLCLPLVPLCLPLVSFLTQTRNPACL